MVPILWALGEEVADGGEKLPGVHSYIHPLPKTCSRASLSDMPSRTSLRIRCPCPEVNPVNPVNPESESFFTRGDCLGKYLFLASLGSPPLPLPDEFGLPSGNSPGEPWPLFGSPGEP